MATKPKIYHFDEVAKHNDRHDCWLLIHGKVCSQFLIQFFSKLGELKITTSVFDVVCLQSEKITVERFCILILLNLKLLHQVYNVTRFLEEHPGGEEVLIAASGKIATL